MKILIPYFNGEDAKDWIFKIEELFEAYDTPKDQRMKFTLFHMDGPAYAWYKWVTKNKSVRTWREFLDALLLSFGSSLYDNLKIALKEL